MSDALVPNSSIRGVVFDLDDTLYDCLGQCVGPAHREAARAMVEAGARASVEEILEARLALAGVAPDLDGAVAAAFRSVNPLKVAEAGRRAFFDRDPGSIVAFAFAMDVVTRVRAVARTALLSTGHPPTQRKKLVALGLETAFDDVLLDDVFGRSAKEATLEAWTKRVGIPAASVLVVGDRPDNEIAAAIRLGMQSLRIRGGEFASRPTPVGVPEADDIRAVLTYFAPSLPAAAAASAAAAAATVPDPEPTPAPAADAAEEPPKTGPRPPGSSSDA